MLDVKNTYFGFTDDIKQPLRGKIEKTLNKLTRHNENICMKKEFIYSILQEGSKPYIKEDYTRNDYRINNLNDTFYIINKTLYDYACYLIENDYINEQKAKEFITTEKTKEIEKIKIKLEQEQKKENCRLNQQIEQQNFENWLDEKIKQYDNEEKYALAKTIYSSEIGQTNEFFIKKLLVLIDNINDLKCKDMLKDWLHNHNKTSKKVFYHITGIKLPNTSKSTITLLNNITVEDYKQVIPYKKRAENKEIITEIFYKLFIIPEPHFVECQGEYLKKHGLDLFITEDKNQYTLTEATSGAKLVSANTKNRLMMLLNENIDRFGIDAIKQKLNEFVEKYGMSPKYIEGGI